MPATGSGTVEHVVDRIARDLAVTGPGRRDGALEPAAAEPIDLDEIDSYLESLTK